VRFKEIFKDLLASNRYHLPLVLCRAKISSAFAFYFDLKREYDSIINLITNIMLITLNPLPVKGTGEPNRDPKTVAILLGRWTAWGESRNAVTVFYGPFAVRVGRSRRPNPSANLVSVA
jgi:hypothetical protein